MDPDASSLFVVPESEGAAEDPSTRSSPSRGAKTDTTKQGCCSGIRGSVGVQGRPFTLLWEARDGSAGKGIYTATQNS